MKTWYLMPRVPCKKCTSCAKNKECKFLKAFRVPGAILKTTDDVTLISRDYVENVAPDLCDFVEKQMFDRVNDVRETRKYFCLEHIQKAVNAYAEKHQNDKAKDMERKVIDPEAYVMYKEVHSWVRNPYVE